MTSVTSPVLVGRDSELARLLGVIEVAATGRPQLVVLSGEAGIGKSRLLAEVADRARASGSRVLFGGSLDIGDAGVPFLPLAEALRGLARATPPGELEALLGPTRSDLASIAPELALPGEPRGDRSELSTAGQARLFERVLELIGRLAPERPVVFVLEDAHWIDRATRDLVTYLVRNVTTERVAAFLSVRTDDLPAGHPSLTWLAELDRAPGGTRLQLQPLDREGIVNQLTAIAGARPDPDIVDRVWNRSEGNPFFAEELFAATGDGQATALLPSEPETLIEILRGRLRGLSAETHEVVGAAAIAGRAFDERLLAAVLDRPVAELRRALREAIEGHVLVEEASGAFRLRHALLREVLERSLLAGERRDLHARFAEALSAEPALGDPAPAAAASELAHHWTAAGRTVEAYATAIGAGVAADAVHAFVDAHREYERALSLEPTLPPDRQPSIADRLDLRRRAAEAADLAGEIPRATELIQDALSLVPEADPVTAGVLHSRLGYLLWAGGNAEAGVEAHRTAVRLVPDDPPSPARARALGGLAGSLMGPGGYEESAELARAAIACAEAVGAVAEEARARNVLGFDLVATGDVDVGLEELRRSRDLAIEGGPPDMVVVAHYNLALNLAEAGQLSEALAEATAGREAGRRNGLDRRFGWDLAALSGDVLMRLGRWDEADRVTSEQLRLDRRELGSAFLSAVRGRLDALRGDLDEAERRLENSLRLGAADDPDVAAYVAAGHAEVAFAADRPELALDAVEAALVPEAEAPLFIRVPLLALGLRAAADLVGRAHAVRHADEVTALTGRAGRLELALREAAEQATAPPTLALVAVARAELDRIAIADERDRAARSTGPADSAARRWAALAADLDDLGDRYHGAYARWRAGEAELQARGTRGDAGPLLTAAHDAARDLGARPLAGEIAALARRARIDLAGAAAPLDVTAVHDAPEAPTTTSDGLRSGARDGAAALKEVGLSDREIEVLRLVAAGRTNGQIADRLFITRKTAGVHVTHILDKLGVVNRVEAAMVAARLGLEPDDEP